MFLTFWLFLAILIQNNNKSSIWAKLFLAYRSDYLSYFPTRLSPIPDFLAISAHFSELKGGGHTGKKTCSATP
jgi:hypothetical protein